MKKQVFNPFLPSYEYVADGEPRVFGDRLYIYGSHDLFNGEDFCLGDYVCYSAHVSNLTDWIYEGVIYCINQDPRNKDGKMHMCAPDVIQGVDGRYYLYYQLHMLTITSVAVCNTLVGNYEFYGYVQHSDGIPLGEKKGDVFAFDPGILMDDGTPYLYVGFSPLPGWFKNVIKMRGNNVEEAVCLQLAKDMKTIVGCEMPIIPGPVSAFRTEFEGHAFFEASSPRKINGKYYFVYSSELSHELCYAISDFPNKDFRFGGTLVSIGNIGFNGQTVPDNYTGNTHGGMVEVNGQWYIFYHRQTNLQKCARQGCAEKIFIQQDGSIMQTQTTSCGLNDGPLLGVGKYEARIAYLLKSINGTFPYIETKEKNKGKLHPYFTQTGIDRNLDGDQYIANMRNGAVAGYRYFEMNNCPKVTVFVSGKGKGKIDVKTDLEGKSICEIQIEVSGKNQIFHSKIDVSLNGIQSLYFTYIGKGYIDFHAFELD